MKQTDYNEKPNWCSNVSGQMSARFDFLLIAAAAGRFRRRTAGVETQQKLTISARAGASAMFIGATDVARCRRATD